LVNLTSQIREFEILHKAIRRWAGEPFSVSTFRREQDASSTFTALDVVCHRSEHQEKLRTQDEFTFLTTAGVSVCGQPSNFSRVELVWRIAGRRSWEEIQLLSQSLATIAALPVYRPSLIFAPGVVIQGLSLPIFTRMDSLFITHWGISAPEYLPGLRPPVLLLWIKPLYGSETSVVEQLGDQKAALLFRQRLLDLDNPLRFSLEGEELNV
jgi:Suppressor of fused protein (SUFU)